MAVELYFNAWFDTAGNFLQTRYFWDPGGLVPAPEGLGIYMTDLSNAGLSSYVHGPQQFDETTEAGNSLYQSVSQVAQMVFSDDAGSTCVVTIPAPKAAIFLPDGLTVNTSNVDVALFISTAIGSGRLYSAAGNPVTTFVRGFRAGKSVS